MNCGWVRALRVRCLGSCLFLTWLAGAGCSSAGPLERSGVTLHVPGEFHARPLRGGEYAVPGKAVAAWQGPTHSSLVVYTALPVPDGTPASYAEGLANRLENLPGVKVVSRGVATIAGVEAARVEVVAPGTGDAVTPSGAGTPVNPSGGELIPTRVVYLAFLRPADTLCLLLRAPEAELAGVQPKWDAILKSLKIEGGGLVTSSY
jgi:hypothetical protein